MEASYEIHCSIASYARALNTHVVKTDEHISSLQTQIASFKSAQHMKDDTPEELSGELPLDAEDAVVAALERERLSIIMDIQEQEFAQKKLTEMISESSELIHAVSQFYKDVRANKESGWSQEGSTSRFTVSQETERLIRANIHKVNNMLSKLYDSIKQSVSQTQVEFIDNTGFQEALNSLVDSLNEGYKMLS